MITPWTLTILRLKRHIPYIANILKLMTIPSMFLNVLVATAAWPTRKERIYSQTEQEDLYNEDRDCGEVSEALRIYCQHVGFAKIEAESLMALTV